MQRISLDALATQQLELAAAHGGRPAAYTVVGGHERVLRQTVVGMLKGSELRGGSGDLLKIPNARHGVQAQEDSAILLTVAKLP